MNARERVLKALELEEPDMVPVHSIAIDGNNVNKVLGKEPEMSDFEFIALLKEQDPEHYAEKLTEAVPLIEVELFSGMVEAALKLGFDAMQIGIIPYEALNDRELTDPWGRIWEMMDNEGNIFPFYKKGLIAGPEEWERWPKPDIDKLAEEEYEFVKTIYEKFKDEDIYIMATDDFIGIFESTWQSMGMVNFSRQLIKNPSHIKERFEFQTKLICELVKASFDAGLEVWVESGDLAYKSGPMISPDAMRKLLLPCYKKLVNTAHKLGGKCILHTDGNIMPILDLIVEAGFDGLHSLDPVAGVDIAEVKRRVGDKLCLLGNIDVSYVLSHGSKEDVEEAVKRTIEVAAPGGGFILSPTNMHPGVKPENLRWMVEAARRYGVYPIGQRG
ncbi:MAG: uroporphyrinogen decarboxylase family protein [Candidatus Freyarchaeota archaeon]